MTFGRIGKTGQSSTKEFSTAKQANASFAKLVAQKERKGYVEKKWCINNSVDETKRRTSTTQRKSDDLLKLDEAFTMLKNEG